MPEDPSTQYWYNMKTGQVEKGYVSSVVDRVGPFATEAEAARALEKLHENSAKWAAEEEASDK